MKKKFFKKALAFTLAEVLITLSILGVVAAITVPSLTNKNTEKQIVTKVKKEYSALAEAYEQIIATDGPASKWLDASKSRREISEILASHFIPYLAVAKDCGFDNRECVADDFVTLINGNKYTVNYNRTNDWYYKILLKDGSSLVFEVGNNASYAIIWVDIDGPKGKNTFGKDWFCFNLTDKGLIPRGSQQADEPLSVRCSKSSTDEASGVACAAWVVYKGNMDYLRKNVSWD